MCLVVYLGCAKRVVLRKEELLSVEEVTPVKSWLRKLFANPYVYYIGSSAGCGCSFPSWPSINGPPLDEYDDWFLKHEYDEDPERRELEISSAARLIELVKEIASEDAPVEVLALWDDGRMEEQEIPLGVITRRIRELNPERFLLNEGRMHHYFV